MTCILCNSRKARRGCPAAHGEICAQCCAEQREEKLDCPLDCPYLIESRKHEKRADPSRNLAHPEVELTDSFLGRVDVLLNVIIVNVGVAALSTPEATDADVREALDAYIQTLKTAESGLIYETKPSNPYAATILEKIKARVEDLRRRLAEHAPEAALRDKDLLGVLVFVARVAASLNNGRRKCRAFMSMIKEQFGPVVPKEGDPGEPPPPASDAPSGLIITP